MKKYYFTILLLAISISIFSQQPYYDDVDLTLTGLPLRDELATKIINTHTNTLSYSEARDALKIIDLEPSSATHVLLLYGFSNDTCETNTSNDNDHRTRKSVDFGGGATCEWNREHVYPKSLGTPNLGQTGPGADAHHLRGCDVQRNGQRGSLFYANGSGNSGTSGGGWYPGDEWKGDAARIILYMYVRYGSQCLPDNVIIGSTNSIDSNMIDLLLDWNAEDPVSTYEDTRNTYLENTSNTYGQGNRNPFIDEPYLATLIWGGTPAEDRWGLLSVDDFSLADVEIYPNPSFGNTLTIKTNEVLSITFFDILGKQVLRDDVSRINNQINIENLNSGIYMLRLQSEKGTLTKKFIKR